ncbi:MFS general substrate transporter [Atractiella rhizophila]|nr:MFS general substrate transporter [Atractiella rhizophila]
MGLGILEPKSNAPVPGTSLLDELKGRTESHVDTSKLKVDDQGRVLVPQPSNDPRDPLNWPQWKKEAAFANICFATGLIGACGPLIAPGFLQIARELGVTVDKIAKTNSGLLLALGCVMFFQSAIGIKWGRRPVYLGAAILMIAGDAWSYADPSVDGLMGSRILQGLAMAPVEALATATIADLFFVHQRGMRAALWGLSLLGGINIAPLINGYVISDLGWRYCFLIILPFYILSFFGFLFFGPETAYNRAKALEIDQGHSASEAIKYEEKENLEKETEQIEELDSKNPSASALEASSGTMHGHLPPKTFIEELKPWSGYSNETSLLACFLRPFPLFFSPVVLWGFLTYGIASLLLVLLSAVTSVVFGGPPHFFTSKQTGLVSLSPLIFSIFGSLVAGYISDFLTTFLARRNKVSVFEPEMRLFLMGAYVVCNVSGYIGLAYSFKNEAHWFAPTFSYGLVNLGQKFLSTSAVVYIIDVHRHNTSEAQAVINFSKNLIAYFLGARINGWVVAIGPFKMFMIFLGVTVGVFLTTIPMYRYGKVSRLWWKGVTDRYPKFFGTQ